MKLTKQQYIDNYQRKNDIKITNTKHIVLPCDCGKPLCKGWVVLNKQGHTISKFK